MTKQQVIEQISTLHPLNDSVIEKLSIYVDLLTYWNKKINLVSSNTDIWQRHILDSAQLIKLIPNNSKILTDFGAGAGIPSLILAIISTEQNINSINIIEATTKKATFLRTIIRECSLQNVTIHNNRIENISPTWASNIITARAFAPLEKLLEYIFPFYQKDSLCIFPKGVNFEDEISIAQKNWNFNIKKIPSISDNNGVILEISDISIK